MLWEMKEPPGSHHKPAAGPAGPATLPRELLLKLAPSYGAVGGTALGFDQLLSRAGRDPG